MKIVFESSELKEGIIKVSLDGGFTYADYEIASVKESGIPLDDSQRYDKIKIKGPANILKSLDVVSNVKVEGEQSEQTPLYSKKDNNYYAWQTPSGLVCYTRTLNSFEDLEVFSLVPEDIVSPETYIPKFKSATGKATMFGTGAIFTWQNGTLHYYNDMVKGGPEEYDLQRYEDGDYYLPPIITINPPTWFDRTDPLSSIVPKGEYIMSEGHQRLGNGQSSLSGVWSDGWNFFIRTTDDYDCIYSGLEITEEGVVHYITGGRLGWSDCH